MTTTMKRVTVAVLATTLVVALSGCSNWSKRDRNTAIGAGAGAIQAHFDAYLVPDNNIVAGYAAHLRHIGPPCVARFH